MRVSREERERTAFRSRRMYRADDRICLPLSNTAEKPVNSIILINT